MDEYYNDNYGIEKAIRNKVLLERYYWIESDQIGGRFYNIRKTDSSMYCELGLCYPIMEHQYNNSIYASYINIGTAYWYTQPCLNGKINRERIIINTMLYTVDIRKGNQIKYKI